MIDLKSKPFYLNDQQIRKVQSILDSMTLDENRTSILSYWIIF